MPATTRFTLFILLCLIGGWTLRAAAAEKPNIVLIVSDDHGWTDYGFMGHAQVRTPHLDKLAAGGLVFARPRAVESLLPEPRQHHHRPVSAPAQDHVQRSARQDPVGRVARRAGADGPLPRGDRDLAAGVGEARVRQLPERQVVAGQLRRAADSRTA